MLRLFPIAGVEQRVVEPGDAYAELALAAAPLDRPYVIVNMVATADGQARVDGDTSSLGNDADMALFLQLREQVDCVMAGTATIAAEQYKGPASKPAVRERRERRGLRERPLFATVTRSGVLPLEAPVFGDAEIDIAVFSEAETGAGAAAANVTTVATLDPREILSVLRERFGVRTLLLEGGPRINAAFFAAGLVDELFLTLAPVLTGSSEPFPIIAGVLPQRQQLHLVSVLTDDEHLYLRYRVD